MKRQLWISILVTALLLLTIVLSRGVQAQSGGNYDLEWNVIGTTGDQFIAGGNYQVGFTLGQAQEPQVSAGSDYQVVQGFWAQGGIQPTTVDLIDFYAEPLNGALAIHWETASEIDTLGFHLYRSGSGEPGTFDRLNQALIPSQSPGGGVGASYEWVDAEVCPAKIYFYLLEDVDATGLREQHGPISGLLKGVYSIYLPLVTKGD